MRTVVLRAFWKINGMVCPPEEVYTDPDVVACTGEALGRHSGGPPVAQPTREQLTAALARTLYVLTRNALASVKS